MLNVYCLGALAFGLLMGYLLGWSTRRAEPNGSDVAGLLATVLGGTVITVLNQLLCEARLPLYLVGLTIGYAVYIALLKLNFSAVRHSYESHNGKPSPLFPWIVREPCCGQHNDHPQNGNDRPN